MIWRIGWHDGFGGTSTAETDNPVAFIENLRRTCKRLDHIEVFGCSVAPVAKQPELHELQEI